MTVPGKLYYKITELSGDKWPSTTKGDILEWSLAGHFPFYKYFDGMQAVAGAATVEERNKAALAKVAFNKMVGDPIDDQLLEQTENGKYEMPPITFLDGLYAEIPTEVIAKMVLKNEDPVQDTLFFVPGKEGDFYSGVATEDGFEDIPYTVYKRDLLVSGSDVEKMEAKYPTLTDDTGDSTRVTKERKQEEFIAMARVAILTATLEAKAENLEKALTFDVGVPPPKVKRKGHNPEDTDDCIIGVLLEILKEKTELKTDTAIIEAIAGLKLPVIGLSASELTHRFPGAKRSIPRDK